MHANRCVYYDGCRYQQSIVQTQKKMGTRADSCFANQVRCDDEKTDMEKRCPLFKKSHKMVA
jgi:hypothetical protein